MAKSGLSESHIKGILRKAASGPGWVLCVGAGISRPAFPDWRGLVQRLVAKDTIPLSDAALRQLQDTFSSDALIQAAMDRLGLTEEKFAGLLASELLLT